jgi:hypothetical protein
VNILPVNSKALLSIALTLFAPSCAMSTPDVVVPLEQRSILVLPVVNQTTSAEAPEAVLCTIGNPLIQRGFYVLPVIPSIEILRAEGLYEGGQLADIAPSAFGEHLGADAVLYITLHSWDTSYAVLASSVSVAMTYTLVDTATGATLWEDSGARVITSDTSQSSGNPFADLIAMAVSAAVTAAAQEYVPLARQANVQALRSLPIGPIGREREEESRETESDE